LIMETAKKEFVHADFELNLVERRPEREIYAFSESDSAESYHAYEEELSDWAESECDEDSEEIFGGDGPKKEESVEIESENGQSFPSDEDEVEPDLQVMLSDNPFALRGYPRMEKTLVSEIDVCMNVLSMLMSGGRGLSSLYTHGFQIFKFDGADKSKSSIVPVEGSQFQVVHISDGGLFSILKKFCPYINLTRQVLDFCEAIRKTHWAYNRYVSEFCAVLDDSYMRVHDSLVKCYSDIQVNYACRQASLLRLYSFTRRTFHELSQLWTSIGKKAFGPENSSLSHQQRYGLILNELYLKEFQNEIKLNASGVPTNPIQQAQNPVPSSAFLRMFSLCRASIRQILGGTQNTKVRPVMLDVHLGGEFWAAIREKIQ